MKHNRGSLPGPFGGEAVIGVGGRDPRVIGSPLVVSQLPEDRASRPNSPDSDL
jgi:hypothetical protein